MRESWKSVRLEEVLDRKADRLGAAPEPTILTCTENHGLVDQMVHLGRRAATEDVSKYKLVEPLDIVYNVYLLWLGSIGQNLTGKTGVTSPVYEVFRPNTEAYAPFLGLLLRSPELTQRYGTIAIGTVPRRRRTPWENFLNLTVDLPPLDEQRRIVDLIGAVDDAIEAAVAQSDVLWTMTQKLLDKTFSKFPRVEIGILLSGISGGKSPSAEARPPAEDEYGVLKVSAINELGFLPSEAKTIGKPDAFNDSMSVKAGDVLISRANTPERVGLVCLVDRAFPNLFLCDKTLRMVPGDGVDPAALVAVFASTEAREQIQLSGTGTSGSMKNISQKSIRQLSVRWPSGAAEQSRIGALNQSQLEVINQARATAKSLRTLRTELLSALLSGAHRIPETYDELMAADLMETVSA